MGPQEGRWDVSSNASSYIDDGCPTVYRGSAPGTDQSQRSAGSAYNQRQVLDSTPRSATRVRPIDGDLLQRLFRATMDEKRRVAEETRAHNVVPRGVGYVVDLKARRSDREPGGSYIPEHLKREAWESERRHSEQASGRGSKILPQTTSGVGAKEVERDAKEVHVRTAKEKSSPRKSSPNAESHDIEILGRCGEEAHVNLPLSPVEEEPGVLPEEQAVVDTGEQDLEPAAADQDPDQAQEKTKKQRKKKGKKQQGNDNQATAAKLAADAIMSGALQADNEEGMAQDHIPAPAHFVKAPSADMSATFHQPESSHSRRDGQRRALRSERSTSTRSQPPRPISSPMFLAPSTRATSVKERSMRAESFVSFEEIGQGWAGEPSPRNSTKISKADLYPGERGKWSTLQSDTRETPAQSYLKASQHSHAPSRASVKLKGPHVRDWEEIAQFPAVSAKRVEAQDEWGAGPGPEYHAPSIRSVEGVATGWNGSCVDHPSQEARSSIHSRLVPIDGGKAVALDWGQETLGRSRSNQIAAKNLFNIPVLEDVDLAEAISAQASSKRSDARTDSGKPSRHDARSSRRSRTSHRDIADLEQPQPHRISQSPSAHGFGERGSGWCQATPEVGCSYVSRSHLQSRMRTSSSYRASEAAESDARIGSASKLSREDSTYVAGKDDEGWPADEHADFRDAKPRTDVSGHPSVHDWANTSQESVSAHDRDVALVEDIGQASVSSGYGWENGLQSRQGSDARSEERGSFKQPTASSRYFPSEPLHAYGADEPDAEHHDREETGWPSADSERAGSDRLHSHDPGEHPTIFAGKGWISPHPLSEAPSAVASPPQSKIALPKEAYPQGATMTYEEWQRMQEQGLRLHRNFSQTESDQTRRAKHRHSRYKFAGWGAESSDGHRFEHESSRRSDAERSRSEKSRSERTGSANNHRALTVTSERSSEAYLSDERPRTITSNMLKDDRSTQHSHASSKRQSLLSRIHTLTSWSQGHSGSKQAHDGSEGTHSSRRSSHRSSGRRGSGQHSDEHSSHRHSHRNSRHESDERSKHSSHRNSKYSSDRRSRHRSSVQEREMEAMEEGRNVWSEVPQYDSTAFNVHEQACKARSEVSRTGTSQLYLNRYRPASVSSNGYEFQSRMIE